MEKSCECKNWSLLKHQTGDVIWRGQCFEKANENEPHRPIATGMEFNCMLPLLCSKNPSQLKPHFSPTALSQRQGRRRTGSTSSGSQQTPLSAEDPTALLGLPEMAGQSSCFHPTSLCPSLRSKTFIGPLDLSNSVSSFSHIGMSPSKTLVYPILCWYLSLRGPGLTQL